MERVKDSVTNIRSLLVKNNCLLVCDVCLICIKFEGIMVNT
jgi:hypothetical protein